MIADITEGYESIICPKECACSDGTYYVHCSRRNITEIPKNLPPNAIQLDLSHNFIQHIKNGDFENSTSIERIYLSHNFISLIDKRVSVEILLIIRINVILTNQILFQAFSSLNHLVEVDLTANLITHIDSNLFREGKSILAILKLRNNPLRLNPHQMLLHLPQLQVLNLEACNLTNVYDKTFQNLTGLIALNLARNLFTEVCL